MGRTERMSQGRRCKRGAAHHLPEEPNPTEGVVLTIVGILVVVILVLLAIYLFQRVR
jgi:hypothetical protein